MTQLMELTAATMTAAPERVRPPGEFEVLDATSAEAGTANFGSSERSERRGDRRRPNRSTLREATVTVAAFAASGVLFWLLVGGAMALFGSPWIMP
jgi:hypothetical protein